MKKSESREIKTYIIMFVILITVIVSVITIYLSMDQSHKSFIGSASSMGTKIHQNIYGDNPEEISILAKESADRLEDYISYEIDGSDIDRINSGAGHKWVKSDDSTISILERVIDVASRSKGTFDPSSLPIISLWGIESENVKKPTDKEISETLKNVNYKNIKINHDTGRIKLENSKSSITLSHVQKGAACESIINIYKKSKIKYGIVSVGGTVGVIGVKPGQSYWKISIKNPFKSSNDGTNIAVIKINKGFVSSFGTDEDKIDLEGQRINSLIDLRSGRPIKNDIASVVIVHSDAVISNALCRICAILGRDESAEILNYYGAEAIFIYDNKTIYVTPNIRQHFSVTDSEYSML